MPVHPKRRPSGNGSIAFWWSGRARLSSLQKAKLAISVTADSQVVLPTVKIIGREVKRFAWDDRSAKARFGLGGTAIALAVSAGRALA